MVAPVDGQDLEAADITRPLNLLSVLLEGLLEHLGSVFPHVPGNVVPDGEIIAAWDLAKSDVFGRCLMCMLTHLTPIDSIQTHSRSVRKHLWKKEVIVKNVKSATI